MFSPSNLLLLVLLVVLNLTLVAEDPNLWLEEVEGEKALKWVRKQNKISQKTIEAHPAFKNIHEQTLKVLESDDRIPYFKQRGNQLYNFWQGQEHIRGLWRRTTLEEYKKEDTAWETVIDIDKIAKTEKENWVYKGVEVLQPSHDRAIVRLSRGGKDASVYREFDLNSRTFVPKGFKLEEAKSELTWMDRNTTLVATDFGKDSLTNSGYPRIVKLWKRGQPLSDARKIFEGKSTDVGIWPLTLNTTDGTLAFIRRSQTFYKGEYHFLKDNKLLKLPLPEDARIKDYYDGQLLIELKSKWDINSRTMAQGALVSLDLEKLLNGAIEPKIVHKPDIHSTITSVDVTADAVIVNTMTKVKSRLLRYIMNDGEWINHSIFEELKNGVIYISNTSPHRQDYTLSFQNFLTPATLYHVPPVPSPRVKLKQAPRHFDASRLTVQQHWATSKDGTQVPYFLVGDKTRRSDGKTPTLLYAYGGFEISMRPWYSSTTGINWFARGGVYALANIRGGGEFGPSWHQSALKTKRNKTYEDFIAVAENLIRKGITTPRHLGIRGGSNGGLLTGVALTKRPDLFNAVVCQVPLLDMQRYTKLLAGHSWIAEYGDPEIPEIWNFWKKWSPYHNIQKDIKYPRVLFTTSTKDDRVHPGHARKMVARMKKQGHSVLYYENIEGGHSGAANLKQTAYAQAIAYAYLLQQLK
ncbi:MAG: S9 family peptidase [Opitutae bacterium]|nr:S9 family peptidase [Opitutae bacterium]